MSRKLAYVHLPHKIHLALLVCGFKQAINWREFNHDY